MSFFGGEGNGGRGRGGGGEKGAVVASEVDAAIKALELSCLPRGSREIFVERSAEALSVLRGHIAGDRDPHDGNNDGNVWDDVEVAAAHVREVLGGEGGGG